MPRRLALLLFAATLLHAADFTPHDVNPQAAGMSPERLARIPRRLQEFVDAGKAAGYVTLVARHGHVALLSAVGFRDLESKTPMHTDTVFRIFSMTKPMTGTAAMLMVEDGRFAIIDPVEKYLPEFKGQLLKDGARPKHPITILEVLNHTSGIQEPPKGLPTLAEGVAASARLPLEFEPGTTWRYRTAGINTAGRIIEVVSGMPYEKFMDSRIFEPLGMKNTGFTPPADASPPRRRLHGDERQNRAHH